MSFKSFKIVEIPDLPFCNEDEKLFKERCEKGITVKQLWEHIERKHNKTPLNTGREEAIKLLKEAEKELLGNNCCVSCGRFIDGKEVEHGVKCDDGTEDMCLNCYDKMLEKV